MPESAVLSFIKKYIFRDEYYSNILVPTKDLNDFKINYTSAIIARAYNNSPSNSGVYFVACVNTTTTEGYYSQIAMRNGAQGIYLRHYINENGWTNWITIS